MGNFERTRDFTHFCRVRFTAQLIQEFWDIDIVDHLWVQLWDQLEETQDEES